MRKVWPCSMNAFAGPEEEGDPGPAPVLDVDTQCAEGLGFRAGRNSVDVEVAGYVGASQTQLAGSGGEVVEGER